MTNTDFDRGRGTPGGWSQISHPYETRRDGDPGFLGRFLILAGGGHVHDRAAEICKAHHGQFPAMREHVEAREHEGNRCKGQREEGERREQFPNDVKLRDHDDCQKPPQTHATIVLELGLHSSLLIRATLAVCRQFLLQQTVPSNNGVHFLAFRAQEQCTEDELWVDWR